jgi:hypothetical protein
MNGEKGIMVEDEDDRRTEENHVIILVRVVSPPPRFKAGTFRIILKRYHGDRDVDGKYMGQSFAGTGFIYGPTIIGIFCN